MEKPKSSIMIKINQIILIIFTLAFLGYMAFTMIVEATVYTFVAIAYFSVLLLLVLVMLGEKISLSMKCIEMNNNLLLTLRQDLSEVAQSVDDHFGVKKLDEEVEESSVQKEELLELKEKQEEVLKPIVSSRKMLRRQ